jgi:flagellar M-ring protein FliF
VRERLQSLLAWHAALESGRRMQLYAALVFALVGVGGSAYWATWTPYQPLISGRAYDEVLDAAAALQPSGIPYRIEDNGTLSVPVAQLGQARAALSAADGLPSLADVGELRLGLTPRAQNWAFIRAREGDIARMINGIAGVSGSRVAITPRVDALFADEEQPARASVFLKHRPGHALATAQVEAVVNLVANSVEGLEPENVSVVDERGKLLNEGLFGSGANDPLELLEYQVALEQRYEDAVSDALDPLLGYQGGFSVTATVDVDRTSAQTVTKVVETDKQALLSEQLSEQSSEEASKGGVPGVDANLPERPAAAVRGGGKSESTAITSNYVYPTVDTVTDLPSGRVQRVNVAVQVDSARIAALAEAADSSAEELQTRIQEAVRAAVGFDANRNDQVNVSFVPFAEPAWVEGEAVAGTWQDVATELAPVLAPWIVAALGLLLGFVYVVRPLMAAATAPAELEADLSEGSADEGPSMAERLRIAANNFESIEPSDLNRLVYRESDAAARVLRQWARASGE